MFSCVVLYKGLCLYLSVTMMEVGRVETVPSLDRNNSILYNSNTLEHSFDDIHSKKTSTLRSELTNSFGIDAHRVVELDLYNDDDSEDEGYVIFYY